MAISIQIQTVANEIYSELNNPTDTSVGSISFWLQCNVGQLNTLLGTSYTLNDAGNEVSPELGLAEKDIFKTMFNIYYYDKMIRSGLGASAFTAVTSVDSDGGSVKMVNRNTIALTYVAMKRDEKSKLNQLINNYKLHNNTPLQISGDDVFSSEPFVSSPAFDRTRTS